LDFATTLNGPTDASSIHYRNAKVVLIGDAGVGKSSLGLVLTGHNFVSTEATHGHKVWSFDRQEVQLVEGFIENREILLWDLAAHSYSRLINPLHLNEVKVAVLVFDSSQNITQSIVSIRHWHRMLRLAGYTSNLAPIQKTFLVDARNDRTRIDMIGKNVRYARIDVLVQELGFVSYFKTSAKEGLNITVLANAIRQVIDWENLPKVTSTNLFQNIRHFLGAEKQRERLLSSFDDLYKVFLKSEKNLNDTKELYEQFKICIGFVESKGLIRRLRSSNLVLLEPMLLDEYAFALIYAARKDPQGLNSISEMKAREGIFPKSAFSRLLTSDEQEKLLLSAIIDEMLRLEIAKRKLGRLHFTL
jgi:GTPase SAR1 family protein